jgi:hypothetical protein
MNTINECLMKIFRKENVEETSVNAEIEKTVEELIKGQAEDVQNNDLDQDQIEENQVVYKNQGKMIIDCTVCPQNIA